jgi:hypothetical protein
MNRAIVRRNREYRPIAAPHPPATVTRIATRLSAGVSNPTTEPTVTSS